ncbi:MAG: hypothetical protein JXA82_06550 [Sedimentisphaerales bacterium]|nr:hypothetical protein [Sedimentisphaerales bacterium]
MAVVSKKRRISDQPDDAQQIWDKFRQYAFTSVWKGYQALTPSKHIKPDEPDITGEIICKIRDFFDSASSPSWVDHFSIHDDPPINKPGRKGKRRQRVDIIIEWCTRPRIHYHFEAKILKENSHPVGNYTGSDGLGQFLQGNYAFECFEAGMLGYVKDLNNDVWAGRLQNTFKENTTKLRVHEEGEWKKMVIVKDLNHTYYTKHNRLKLEPIGIYHLLLRFYAPDNPYLDRNFENLLIE